MARNPGGRHTAALVITAFVAVWIGASASANEAARRSFFQPEQRADRFQRAEQIFPTRMVHAGQQVWRLPAAERGLPPHFTYRWQGKTYSLNDFNQRTRSNALLILKHGAVVHESYFNGALPSTRFISFSTAKSVTSTLVGIALADGLITSLDDPLTQYLPALTGSAYDGVTIREALQMTSGVQWDEESYDWSDTTKPLVRNWLGAYVEQRYRLVAGANGLPRANPPGKHFNYSTMEASILGWLVENASHQRLAEFMEENLWRPAGMESDAAWVLDGPPSVGREMAGGGLLATLRDFGRFGLLMARGGMANGHRIVPSEWVRAATRPDSQAVDYGKLYPKYPLGYGYQWWLLPNGAFRGTGRLRTADLRGSRGRRRHRQAELLAGSVGRRHGKGKLRVLRRGHRGAARQSEEASGWRLEHGVGRGAVALRTPAPRGDTQNRDHDERQQDETERHGVAPGEGSELRAPGRAVADLERNGIAPRQPPQAGQRVQDPAPGHEVMIAAAGAIANGEFLAVAALARQHPPRRDHLAGGGAHARVAPGFPGKGQDARHQQKTGDALQRGTRRSVHGGRTCGPATPAAR